MFVENMVCLKMNLQKEKIVIFMVCAINLFVKLAGLGIEKIVHRWFVI